MIQRHTYNDVDEMPEPDEEGEFVFYKDHAAEVAKLQATIWKMAGMIKCSLSSNCPDAGNHKRHCKPTPFDFIPIGCNRCSMKAYALRRKEASNG